MRTSGATPSSNPSPTTAEPRRRRVSYPGGTGAVAERSERPCTLRAGDRCVIERIDGHDATLVRLGYQRSDRMLRGPLTMPMTELLQLLEAAREAGVLT